MGKVIALFGRPKQAQERAVRWYDFADSHASVCRAGRTDYAALLYAGVLRRGARMRVLSESSKSRVLVSSGSNPQHLQWVVSRFSFQKRWAQALRTAVKASVGCPACEVRASAGTRDGCSARVRNAASDNTGESREGVEVGLVERRAANGLRKAMRAAVGGGQQQGRKIDG